MKKKKIQKEKNLVLLDELTRKEQSSINGGKVHVQIAGTIRVYF